MAETYSFITEYIWIISASGWLFKKKVMEQVYYIYHEYLKLCRIV